MVNMSILQLVLAGLLIFDLGYSVGAAVQELIHKKKQAEMVQNMKNNLNREQKRKLKFNKRGKFRG